MILSYLISGIFFVYQVDPFRQFSRAERLRKFNEMSPMGECFYVSGSFSISLSHSSQLIMCTLVERIVFIGSKTMLANKQMRTGKTNSIFSY